MTYKTPDQSKAMLVELFNSSAKIAGGDWKFEDISAASCTLVDGAEGVYFFVNALGSGLPNPNDAARAVAAYWRTKGLEARVAEVDGDTTTSTYRDSATGLAIQFGATTQGADLTGVTECVPGDADAINRQREVSGE